MDAEKLSTGVSATGKPWLSQYCQRAREKVADQLWFSERQHDHIQLTTQSNRSRATAPKKLSGATGVQRTHPGPFFSTAQKSQLMPKKLQRQW